MEDKLDIKEVCLLGIYNKDGKNYPACRTVLDKEEILNLSILEIAALSITVFDFLSSSVEECKKDEFGKMFKECFDLMFQNRDQYLIKVPE